ncbi:MAG TPA: lipid A biosynthesis lauroyl acyltransferase [Xanthobacteraceae bacterium]|nr:lipid A biosynthesis lauroyl acyltransferase [Xanthobacteraceae bacterium]
MSVDIHRIDVRVALGFKRAVNAVAGRTAALLLRALRLTDLDRTADMFAAVMRTIGPRLREHRIGRANLAAAFPDKSPAEIEAILAGVWDNVGRTAAEFIHLDRMWDYDRTHPKAGRAESTPESDAYFDRMRDDGQPALVFAAHLANWEQPALAAKGGGLNFAALFRRPNLSGISDAIMAARAGAMGTMIAGGPDAPFRIARALEQGQHVGLLVDQHYGNGVDVTFFGRTCKANPMLARLARHIDCPIHGTRAIRLPNNRFRVEMTDAITVPRDAGGRVDVQGTMQVITAIVEGWVREHPEQWLWLHRRWR